MRINDIYIFYQNELKTVSIRQRVKGVQNLPEAVSSAINALQAYAEASGALLAGMPFCCYYNQDMSDLDVEFGFPVDRVLPANGDI
ncbi:MAG: hypothetical protein LBV04_09270, partial [Deferribacteraceae bacterium]|nr:hypothetical protein [Deferribacteraceae bacterium]